MIDSFKRIALVNPPWEFEGSRYWACREPHLPLELLYSEALLRQAGFAARVVDAHQERLTLPEMAARVADLRPDLVVVTTAPTYLFWRCPPPDLKVPRAACEALRAIAPIVAIGPHGSATPRYVLDSLGCQAVVRGEPEQELVRIARGQPGPATIVADTFCHPERSEGSPRGQRRSFTIVQDDSAIAQDDSAIARDDSAIARDDSAIAQDDTCVDVALLPALDYYDYPLEGRTHRHHIFWGEGRGAEVEFSRGCPYGCSFCARRFFRSRYRERPLEKLLVEMRRLKARGVDYVYFIDEVFGLGGTDRLLRTLATDPIVQFGCQTRLDLWDEPRLDLLAAAGCQSLEFGLESPFPEVQAALNKGYRIDPDRALQLMAYAKSKIPWVQGDLLDPPGADPELRSSTEEWRQRAIDLGVWVSEPVTLFPYPGCDLHDEMIGPVDDDAWIKAEEGCA